MFYTDVYVERSKVHVTGYKNTGEKFHQIFDYKPYLFERSNKKTGWTDIFGNSVSPIHFDSIYKAKEYVKTYEDVSNCSWVGGMTDWVYPFIFDTFGPTIEYVSDWIRVASLDIEVKSDEGFPEPDSADYPITAITIGTRKFQVTLGLKPYTPKTKNHRYILCKNEPDLLIKFMEVWKKLDTDIITGWNIEKFDLPYLINRMNRIIGPEFFLKLSPWNRVFDTSVYNKAYKKLETLYRIRGVVVLDYLRLYQTFSYTPQESYSLNHIAHSELDKKKLDYSEYESLNELYEKNHDKFIDYNLRDNTLIFDLDEKLGFINQTIAIAYDSKINLVDALTSVRLWEAICHHHLMAKNICVPKKIDKEKKRRILGGYVKEPIPGRYRWVCSFDFASLYPHLIMMYNISPERMKPDRVPGYYNPERCVDLILDKGMDEITPILKKNDLVMAPLGVVYDNFKPGFLPELMDKMYQDRKSWAEKEEGYIKELVKIEAEMKRRGLQVPDYGL